MNQPPQFPAEILELAAEVRDLVLGTIPGLDERVYAAGKGYGYHTKQGALCGIFLCSEVVTLEFIQGTLLPDPDGLLEASGKRVRRIVFRPGQSLPSDAVSRLLEIAALEQMSKIG